MPESKTERVTRLLKSKHEEYSKTKPTFQQIVQAERVTDHFDWWFVNPHPNQSDEVGQYSVGEVTSLIKNAEYMEAWRGMIHKYFTIMGINPYDGTFGNNQTFNNSEEFKKFIKNPYSVRLAKIISSIETIHAVAQKEMKEGNKKMLDIIHETECVYRNIYSAFKKNNAFKNPNIEQAFNVYDNIANTNLQKLYNCNSRDIFEAKRNLLDKQLVSKGQTGKHTDSSSTSKNTIPETKSLSPITSTTPKKYPQKDSYDFSVTDKKNLLPSTSVSTKTSSALLGLYSYESPAGNATRGIGDFRLLKAAYKNNAHENNNFDNVLKSIILTAAQEQNIEIDKAVAIIRHAKDNNGTKNLKGDGTFKGVNYNAARKFSALVQSKCEKCGIYSGRTNNLRKDKLVGLRTAFIPESVLSSIDVNTTAQQRDQDIVQEKSNMVSGILISLAPPSSR